MSGPVTASVARAELRAAVLRGALPSVILAAADAYRAAPADGDGRLTHLRGLSGEGSACRRRWQEPELLLLTGSPAAVTCLKCRRSVRYRDLTGGGNG